MKGGYTEEDLKHFVDVYNSKRLTHLYLVKKCKVDPKSIIGDRYWCPNTQWAIQDLFTKQKWLSAWIDENEQPVSLEEVKKDAEKKSEAAFYAENYPYGI